MSRPSSFGGPSKHVACSLLAMMATTTTHGRETFLQRAPQVAGQENEIAMVGEKLKGFLNIYNTAHLWIDLRGKWSYELS